MITNSFGAFQPQSFLFGRQYSVVIGAPNQTGAIQYGNVGKKPAPLRVKFDIEKNMLNVSNKAKIEIYNMSQQSRQAIKKGYLVQLKAGYKGLFQQLFVGNVLPNGIGSTRHGPEILTALECGDGESSIVMARLDKSYSSGVTVLQILKDCAGAMNLEDDFNPDGVNSGLVYLPNNPAYGKGFNAKGPVSDTLNKILRPLGLEWSVQDGNLNVIPKTAHNGNQAIIVSTATGMIGVPSSNDQCMKFSSLLNPNLRPGALVKLESDNIALNGFYKIRKSHFEGDTHENKWNVDCECVTAPNIAQTLSSMNLLGTGAVLA